MAETYVSEQPMSAEELAVVSEGFESAPASAVDPLGRRDLR